MARSRRVGISRNGMVMALAFITMVAGCHVKDPEGIVGGEVSKRASQIRLTDITAESGLTFRHVNGQKGTNRYPEIMGAGIALFDYDADGDLDLYLVNGNQLGEAADPSITNALYANLGNGKFTDVTASAGVGDPGYGQGCCAADYDSDGDVDLYVTNLGPDRFFQNNGDGTFNDATEAAGLGSELWGQSCVFFDADGDGFLDLYVQNYLTYSVRDERAVYKTVRGQKVRDYKSPDSFQGAPDRLFRNLGGGSFEDVSARSGLDVDEGKGMGAAAWDFDRDGDVDLFVSNDGMANYMFVNRGDGSFVESGIMAGVATNAAGGLEASMGVDVGDIDGDGLFDLIVPNILHETFALYRNEGRFFTDISEESGLAAASHNRTGFSPNLVDLDNDGDLDLFVTCGEVSAISGDDSYEARYGLADLVLRNDGRGSFADVSALVGTYFSREFIGRGSAAGDIDNDGDVDIVVGQLDGNPVILRNDSAVSAHWITIVLVGQSPNRDAIGTEVEVVTADRRQVALVRGGGSFLSVSDRRLHFGLGEAREIEEIIVRWPRGQVQRLTDVEVDRFLVISEQAFSPAIDPPVLNGRSERGNQDLDRPIE